MRAWFALGDPQTTLARVHALLHRHGLLTPDLRLRDDVGLVSLGDHFDYHGDPTEVAREGLAVLRWLASHPPSQVVILAGNHDLARVMELATVCDEDFAAARVFALTSPPPEAFSARFPNIPTAGLAARDYAGFCVAQRDLVTDLLRAGRMVLAARAAHPDGAPLLLTHAAITERERALLGLHRCVDPDVLAAALNAHLRDAVARWHNPPLDLSPLHLPGAHGEEGGGLLYHRPAHPGPGDAWSWDAVRPRRFDPRALPPGLAQVCGHTGHAKCRALLGPWMSDEDRATPSGGLRTLSVRQGVVRYAMGVEAPALQGATLYLLDADLAKGADGALLSVTDVRAP
jgi:hypothetical protein